MIHVNTGIDGVTFDECYRNRVLMKDGDITIPFIGFEGLLKNKKTTRRNKDTIDVIELIKVQKRSSEAGRKTPRKAG